MKDGFVIAHRFPWNKGELSYLMSYNGHPKIGWVWLKNAYVFSTKERAEKWLSIVLSGYAVEHKMPKKGFFIRFLGDIDLSEEDKCPFGEEESIGAKAQRLKDECLRRKKKKKKEKKQEALKNAPDWKLGFFNLDRLLTRRSDDQAVKNILALGRKIAKKGEVDRVRFTHDAFHGQYLNQEEYQFKDFMPLFINRAKIGDKHEMLDILEDIAVRFERALEDLGMSFGHDYSLIKTEARAWRAMEEKLQADFDLDIFLEKGLATYYNGVSPLPNEAVLSCLGEGLEHPENIVYELHFKQRA